jgi:Ankyrin repeats (3 copies)
LLKHDKVDVNHENKFGGTALIWASHRGDTDIVVELLTHGKIDVNHRNRYGDVALALASIRGHFNSVWELLKRNPCDALAWATAKGNTEIARCVEQGCDPEKPPERKKQRRKRNSQRP